MKRLSDLLTAGAVLTMPDGYRVILADAAILPDGQLWFYGAFDREHFVEFDKIEDDGTYLHFRSGLLTAATVGPLEGEEDEAALAEWRGHLAAPENHVLELSISAMRKGAIDWHK